MPKKYDYTNIENGSEITLNYEYLTDKAGYVTSLKENGVMINDAFKYRDALIEVIY